MAEGCKPDIIPSLLSPEFPFSEDYSQEFPSLLFSLPARSPPALGFFSYLSQTCCQVDPRTHIPSPNKLSYPLVPSFPGNRAYSSPLQFCPVQDTLGIDSIVQYMGAFTAPAWRLAYHIKCGFCKPACLWPEVCSHSDKDHGFLPKSTGVQRPPGWRPRPLCLNPCCLPILL